MNYVNVLSRQLNEMGRDFVAALPSLAIALVVLAITFFVARLAARIAGQAIGHAKVRESLKQLIQTLARLGVWIVGLLIAAAIVLPGFTPASALAGLGIGAVAIGFAFQDIFENFLAGVLIMLREKMRIGDVIECEGIVGKVEHITLRETHVRALSNELTVVPNSMIFKNPVKILTDETLRRHEVVVGVSYDTDLDQAADVIRTAVSGISGIDTERGVEVYAKEFNSSSVDYLVRFWAGAKPRDGWQSKDVAIRAIKRALDDAGIEIPFPYITHTFKEPVPLASAAGED